MSNFKGGWSGKLNPKFKHGWANTPTYMSWRNMIFRCTDHRSKDWEQYGGRGIKVVKRWFSILNFVADMGKKPKNRTLERINNNGNYSPSNCCWATKKQQLANKRARAKHTYARGKDHPNFGRHLSLSIRNKISVSRKGTPAWNKGKHWSAEVRAKISRARRNYEKESNC